MSNIVLTLPDLMDFRTEKCCQDCKYRSDLSYCHGGVMDSPELL